MLFLLFFGRVKLTNYYREILYYAIFIMVFKQKIGKKPIVDTNYHFKKLDFNNKFRFLAWANLNFLLSSHYQHFKDGV